MKRAAVETEKLTKIFRPSLKRWRRLFGRRGAGEVTALRDVDLTIHEGEIFGLVGRNGQGKTTLVKSIAALLLPTFGTIRVFGRDIGREDRAVKREIGLVTSDERSFYWRLSGRQNLLFFARLNGMDGAAAKGRIDELFAMFDLEELAHRPFHEYSNGNKQRLALARALLNDPSLLLLDEPTRSLDPIAAAELRREIRERIGSSGRKTVLITSHNLAEVEELCGRVAILSRGEIKACATLEELRARYPGREDVTLAIRGTVAREALDGLGKRFPGLAWNRPFQGGTEIRFSRSPEDGTLHSVLETVISEGEEIISLDVKRQGLKEIMEEIDKEN